ncbi:MAG: hypothetical protein OEN01_14930 [Candidatus Krumholzibacteria bacterium]|nr:hypothetical protein [Candidatus Krumholzibacteria bacterium]
MRLIRLCFVLSVAVLALAGCRGNDVFDADQSSAQNISVAQSGKRACDVVTGVGHTYIVGQFTFAGSADLVVGGQVFDDVEITTTLLEMRETDTGTLLALTSHAFGPAANPWFVTTDKARLEPTGVPGEFRINSTMKVTAPEGMRGNLTAHGTISLIPGGNGAEFEIHGVLCDGPNTGGKEDMSD